MKPFAALLWTPLCRLYYHPTNCFPVNDTGASSTVSTLSANQTGVYNNTSIVSYHLKTLVQYFSRDVLTLIQEFCELEMEAYRILLLN
eukprot:1499367-Ditylum_brightwellii.AAC.1